MGKITSEQIHLLKLTKKGQMPDGWSPVSSLVWQFFTEFPEDLITKRIDGDGNRFVQLTANGAVLAEWL